MDIQHQNRLEPIQEESEQEDDIEGSKPGEGEEEEDIQIQVAEETKEVTVEDESDEDEDADGDDAVLLRVKRPRRRPRSLSQESFPQMPSTSDQHEEMEGFSVSDRSSHAVDFSDEAHPPEQASLGNKKRSISAELKINISKIAWKKHSPAVQKKTKRRVQKKETLVLSKNVFKEAFPEWLVNLMFSIEEAKTHQLVVE